MFEFKNFRVSSKMLVADLVSLATLLIVGFMGINSLETVSLKIDKIYNRNVVKLQVATDAERAIRRMTVSGANYLMQDDAAGRSSVRQNIQKYDADFGKVVETYLSLIVRTEERKIMERLQQDYGDYMQAINRLVAIKSSDSARQVFQQQVIPRGTAVNKVIEELEEYNIQRADKRDDEVETIYVSTRRTFIIVIAVGVVLSQVLNLLVSRVITKPLALVTVAAQRIAGGNLSQEDIIVSTQDEIGQLTNSFNQMVRNLKSLMRQHERILNSVGEGMCLVDLQGKATFVNLMAERMLGYQAAELLGRTICDIIHHSGPDGSPYPKEECRMYAPFTDGNTYTVNDEVFWRKDGTSFPVEYISTPVWEREEIVGAVCSFKDITDRKNFEAQMTHLANHDPLTGLFNRRRFQEELKSHLAQAHRYGAGGALLFLDLDEFKYVNDSLGHHAGDVLLARLAGLLRNRLRETDVLARIGGDEFAVLLPRTGTETAGEVAGELLEEIRYLTLLVEGHPVRVTASIGIAMFPEHGTTVEELLARADLAMYQAKENGRNGYCVFSQDRQTHVSSQWTWETRIRDALEKELFVVHYQPILDLRRNRIAHYEALLRMVGEDGRLIPPGAFLHVAERFGLIREIDRWVIWRAIRQVAELRRAGRNLVLEVNLSAKAFDDTRMLDLIQRELAATGVNPSNLVLEITETAAITNMSEAQRFIGTLKALGCRFALDDFGTGFSSFHYLKHLPVDYLKIDGSFIRDLSRSPVDRHLVKAIVEVARGLRMQTIAEFVEDEPTVHLLREYGVDYAQGYHIGRPAEAL